MPASKNSKKEVRYYKIERAQALEEEGKRTIKGYAAVFNKQSEDMGMYVEIREKIEPGAFTKSLREDDQMAFWNHNEDFPIGGTKNGSLRLREDSHGLFFELDLPDTNIGMDVYKNVKSGLIDSMSFGFIISEHKIERGQSPNDPIIRTIIDGQLTEVSPVVFPAFPQTEVEARSLEDSLKGELAKLDVPQEPQGKPIAEFVTRANKAALNAKFQKDTLGY